MFTVMVCAANLFELLLHQYDDIVTPVFICFVCVYVCVCSVPELPARFGQSREFLTYLPSRLSCEFSQLKVIGKGAYGRVYQVSHFVIDYQSLASDVEMYLPSLT